MHEQTGLLNGKGDVGACHHEVLQGTDDAAVGLGIVNRIAVGSELALGINQHGHRLAGAHASAVEGVIGVPLLGQVETLRCALDVDAEEEAQFPHVLHSKFRTQTIDDVLE
jgi:hypothetical protein